MARIEVEVKVHLPYDASGVSAQPGQIITVDTENPYIRGYLETGLLYPLTPLEFSLDMQPPSVPIADAPQHAAQAPDTSAPARGLLPPYDKDTVAQLREELDARGIHVMSDAVKADLITALEADDAAR